MKTMKGSFKPDMIVLNIYNRIVVNPKDRVEEFANYYEKLLNVNTLVNSMATR